jgi:hypothetical protein
MSYKKVKPNPFDGYLFKFSTTSSADSEVLTGTYQSSIQEQIIPSRCGVKNRDDVTKHISSLGLSGEIFVAGIKYKFGDSQPTITGKKKPDESFDESAIRECAEEIGCDFDPLKATTFEKDINGTKIITYILPITEMNAITHKPSIMSKEKDDYQSRVQIVFYGTLDEFNTSLKTITMRLAEETDIIGVMAYPFKNL